MTADVDDDTALAAAFRDDPGRFTDVHDRYFAGVYRYAAARLDPQTAEDIAAETFCVAFGKRDAFDAALGSVRGWLFGIATNLIARHRRTEARRLRALARMPAEPGHPGHEEHVADADAAARLRPRLLRAIAALPRGERDALLLVTLGELSYQEVAQALGISPGTVGSRLNRARTKLHRALDEETRHG